MLFRYVYICVMKKIQNRKAERLENKSMRLMNKAENVADAGQGNKKRAARIMARSQKAWDRSREVYAKADKNRVSGSSKTKKA